MIVLNFLFSMLPLDIIGDELHRAGAVQRIHGNQIVDTCRLELFQIFAHAVRLKLENPNCCTLFEHLEGLLIIQRNIIQVVFLAMIFLHKLDRRFQD